MARKVSARRTASARKGAKQARKRAAAAAGAATISVWEDDPANGDSPVGGTLVQRPAPQLQGAPLPTRITNPTTAPPPQIYTVGTPEFRYWAAADALRRGSDFWGPLLPGTSWQVGNTLPVDLDNGLDLNAFYDRIGLKFFHAPVNGRAVFSGESPDVVCHELGHAVLDAVKPQLWDAASIEIGSFHEAFGDMSAILTALQLPSLRHAILAQTGGAIHRSTRLSRLAEQLGWAIRQSNPQAVEDDCLRNAMNSFFYQDPDTLPTDAPASSLSSEVHSFSRVFTGGFFEGLGGMFSVRPTQDDENLEQVSQDIAQILLQGIDSARVVPNFYSQVAASMLNVAATKFSSQGYEPPLRSAFVQHGLLPPASALAVARAPAMAAAAAAAGPTERRATALAQSRLSVGEYGLGVDSIVVYSAAEPKRFDVAGAALAVGSVPSPTQDTAAKSFFEDLLRRGRVKISDGAGPAAGITRAFAPKTHETHTHELRREGAAGLVLRRVRIACRGGHWNTCGCHDASGPHMHG